MSLTVAQKRFLDLAPPKFRTMWEARLSFRLSMHPGQVKPKGDWNGWLIQAGRGFGKTLPAAFDTAEHAIDNPGWRLGVISPTLGDVRDTCLEGETGLLQVLTSGTEQYMGMGLVQGEDFTYNRSLLEIEFPNGSHIKGFGSEKPDRLRGPQHHRVWFDELAAFKDANKGDAMNTAFNNAMLGLRLGQRAQWIGSTTPRYNELIIQLSERANVVITRGTTYDNLANLSENFIDSIMSYEGTPLERQELLGEIVEITGSMFKAEWFTYFDVDGSTYVLSDGSRIPQEECSHFITVDPALSTKDDADYSVFAVWARTPDGRKLLVELVRARLEAPDVMATGKRLVQKWRAGFIGFEAVAYQAALVQFAKRDGIPAVRIRADKDKVTRALPLATQMKAEIVQLRAGAPWLEDLERELLFFPDGPHDDQVDALAYGAVEDRIRRTLTAS